MPPGQNEQPTTDNERPDTPSPLKQIRTFQGDVADALTNQKESLFSIQQTESLKRGSGMNVAQADNDEAEAEKRKKFFSLLGGGLILLLLAGVGGWYTYGEFVRRTAPPVVSIPESRLVSAESSVELDLTSLTREDLFTTIEIESANLSSGELRHFVLKQGASSTAPLTNITQFLSKLESRAPGSLVRAFEPNFMLGSLGQSRFIILKLISFENTFGGMLLWEENMASDIGDLFATAGIMKSIAPASVFKDIIFKNKDARALLADGGEGIGEVPVLLYSFLDNEILIITDNPETLERLIDRLTREKLTR